MTNQQRILEYMLFDVAVPLQARKRREKDDNGELISLYRWFPFKQGELVPATHHGLPPTLYERDLRAMLDQGLVKEDRTTFTRAALILTEAGRNAAQHRIRVVK